METLYNTESKQRMNMSIFVEDLGMFPVGTQGKRARRYKMLCEVCGNTYTTQAKSVKAGKSNFCISCRDTRFEKHGSNGSYSAMMTRCYNKNVKSYKDYGKRGVIVCDEWKGNPKAFGKWADSNGWEKGLTIDRVDPNGNYEPKNCKWIPKSEQSINKREDGNMGKSGVRGVQKHKKSGKYCAVVKGKHLGLFESIEDAENEVNKYKK